jgi:ATP-dependent Clp protease ATP-binding subunit ClpA
VASWVREHKSLVLWVKDRLGSSIQGWQPYGNWSHKPKHANDEYLHDLAAQIYRGTSNFENDKGLTAIEGINEIRAILARTGSSVRLIGLSGVGKTRLLEALFDRRIGEGALNPSDVFYTDIAHSPNPEPITFAEHIRTIKKNCSSRR